MKKLTLIILLIAVCFEIKAQEKQIDSFLGIKFGSSKAQVLKAMSARGSTLDLAKSNGDFQNYKNVKIGTRKVDVFSIRFVDDKVFQADFYFIPELEAKTIDLYNDIVEDVTNVYGTGSPFKNFQHPYEDGDGFELSAIKLGKATYNTYWNRINSIVVSIIPAMAVKLEYQDDVLVKVAIEKQNQIKKDDY